MHRENIKDLGFGKKITFLGGDSEEAGGDNVGSLGEGSRSK